MSQKYVSFALGKRIAHLRKQRGMTQLAFSIESGIAKSYVSELEAGKRNPHLFVLEKSVLPSMSLCRSFLRASDPSPPSKSRKQIPLKGINERDIITPQSKRRT